MKAGQPGEVLGCFGLVWFCVCLVFVFAGFVFASFVFVWSCACLFVYLFAWLEVCGFFFNVIMTNSF